MTSRSAFRAVAAAAALATLASACGGSDDGTTAETTTPTTVGVVTTAPAPTTSTVAATTTTAAPLPTAPLTGLPSTDPSTLGRPALVVKIDNHPDAMPQAGLKDADVVYEELVEGISRFAVVFHDKAPYPVGPIRSARTSDPDIVTALGTPLFAWSGGNAVVTSQVARANLVDVGHARSSVEGGYFRERSRRAPHNLYADGRALFNLARPDQGAVVPLFTFREEGEALPPSAKAVDGVKVVFSGTQSLFEWDTEVGGWLRTQYGKAHTDADGTRLAPANVVVMFTQYRRSPADPVSPEAVTVGEGFAWVFTDGHLIEGVWRRSSADKPAELLTADLEPIHLTPGQTWVSLAQANKAAIVPTGTSPSDVPWPR
jgi:hypothetical protein